MPYNPSEFFDVGRKLGQTKGAATRTAVGGVMDMFGKVLENEMLINRTLGIEKAKKQLPPSPAEKARMDLEEAQARYYGGGSSDTSTGASTGTLQFDANGNPIFSGGLKQQEFQLQQAKFYQDQWKDIQKLSDPQIASSRTTLGMASGGNLRANRALSLLNQPIVTGQALNAITGDYSAIIQGGVPNDNLMREEQYNTLQSKWAGINQVISANPNNALSPQIKDYLKQQLLDLKNVNDASIDNHFDYMERANPQIINMHRDSWNGMRAASHNFGQNALQQGASNTSGIGMYTDGEEKTFGQMHLKRTGGKWKKMIKTVQ